MYRHRLNVTDVLCRMVKESGPKILLAFDGWDEATDNQPSADRQPLASNQSIPRNLVPGPSERPG